MSIFNRLFSSKKTCDILSKNHQEQSEDAGKENPENHPNLNPDDGQTNPSSFTLHEIKPEQKDTKTSEIKDEVPQSGFLWRTFSIFISSTFADMQAERDHLKHVVFPKIEEDLQKRRIKLEIVDLRWGVDTTYIEQEDEREASVLKVCLDEIKRCRPFFIGLLGDRYGWVPPVERLKAVLAGEKYVMPEKGKSVTDLEVEFGVLASQEQLVRSVFYFRNPLPYENFSLKKAAMFCDAYNPELTKAEKTERKDALDRLKKRIAVHFKEKNLADKVKSYSVVWDPEKEKVTGLETWGDLVYADILAECENHAKATWDKMPQNWQEQELALLDAFIETNTTTFCGRESLLENLKKHLLGSDNSQWGLVLTGESGSGKSAVFSMVNKMLHREDCFILAHSSGLSPRANRVADLLQIWNKQLADHLDIKEKLDDGTKNVETLAHRLTGEQEKEPVTPIEKLYEKFLEMLQQASAKKRVVLLIDALDRFEPTARAQHMSWLPSLMPHNVRVLITAINGTENKAIKYHKGLRATSIDVFTGSESKEMLDALCMRQHKALPEKIQKIILGKKRADGQPATTSPLWLSLAANMLMAVDYDDFEKMSQLEGRGDQQIESYLGAMADSFDPLPGPLFLSLKNKAGVLFGETFTAAVFNYIAVSRNGLREKDLEKLLPAKGIDWDPLRFANLRRWFKSHFELNGFELQWKLGHNILKMELLENLPDLFKKELHKSIVDYLFKLSDPDRVKVTEIMFHIMEADLKGEAIKYYTSELNDEALAEASSTLAEIAVSDNSGVENISSIPKLIINDDILLNKLSLNYIYSLNEILKMEGNLNVRFRILSNLSDIINQKIFPSDNDVEFNINLEELGFDDNQISNLKKNAVVIATNERRKFWMITKFSLDVMLGELLQDMGKPLEAFKYFNSLGADVIYETALNETVPFKEANAILLDKIGSNHLAMGNANEAKTHYEKCYDIYKDLVGNNQNEKSIIYGFAVSNVKLGDVYRYMGLSKSVLEYYLKGNQLMSELINSFPKDENIITGFSAANERLGSFYEEIGEYENALKLLADENKLLEAIYQDNPFNVRYKLGLVSSNDKIGDILRTMNRIDEAYCIYKANTERSNDLYTIDPNNELYKTYYANANAKCGAICMLTNDFNEAKKYIGKFNRMMREIAESNQENILSQNGLATSYHNLIKIYQKESKQDEVLKCITEGLELFKKYHESNPLNDSCINNLSSFYSLLGDYYIAAERLEEAQIAYEQYKKYMDEIQKFQPENELYKFNLAVAYERLSTLSSKKGDSDHALHYAQMELNILKELYEHSILNFDDKLNLALKALAMGDLCTQNGKTQDAVKHYLYAENLFLKLTEKETENDALKENLAKIYHRLASYFETIKDNSEALKFYTRLYEISDILYQDNSENEIGFHGVISSTERLSALYEENGQTSYAVLYYEKFRQLLESKRNNNNLDNLNFTAHLAYLDDKIARMHESLGNYEKAIIFYENCHRVMEPIYEENYLNIEMASAFSITNERLGILHQQVGNLDNALKYFKVFNELCSVIYGSNRNNLQSIQKFGISYYRLAMLYKEMHNDKMGLEWFKGFKQIFQSLYFVSPNDPYIISWLKKEYNSRG